MVFVCLLHIIIIIPMRLKLISQYLGIIFLISSCSSLNNLIDDENVDPSSFKKGKCYEHCIVELYNDFFYYEYIVFTGDDSEGVEYELKEVVIKPAKTLWVIKRKEDCFTDYDNECLEWDHKLFPKISKKVKVLKDSLGTKNYEVLKTSYYDLSLFYSEKAWREVYCETNLKPKMIREIKHSLSNFGFIFLSKNDSFDDELKEVLYEFQKAYKLPIGGLNYETLEKLEIEY